MAERCAFQSLAAVGVAGTARPFQKGLRPMFISRHTSTEL
jgi:hypothetical protein